jgi:nitrite reductase (NO-forming)
VTTSVTLSTRPPEQPPRPGTRRRTWHLRANAVVIAYLALAVLVIPLRDGLPVPRWLAIHLLLLGAVTNAIVTWSEHFAVALLRAANPSQRRSAVRLAGLNVAIVGVLVGVSYDLNILTIAAATVLVVVVGAHLTSLVLIARGALQGRFAGTVRFYLVGGVALIVGVVLGTLLALGVGGMAHHDPMHAAHVHANVFGWIGLTVLGTLFTLWPTVLRTRMVDGVMRAAHWCLVLTVAGLTITVTALILSAPAVAAVGMTVYAVGLGFALKPFLSTWRRKSPHDAASWSMAAATTWLLVGVVADVVLLVGSEGIDAYLTHLDALVPLLLIGFVGQMLIGALSYLLPVMVGGGPATLRVSMGRMSYGWPVRLALLNVGVPLVVLPVPDWAQTLGWVLVLAATAVFLFLVVSIVVPAPAHAPMAGVALGVVMTLIPVGIAVSGNAAGVGANSVTLSGGTGAVQVVEVSLVDMDIRPGVITVPSGTKLHLVVTNKDAMQHDLVFFPDGPGTRMLAPGQSQTLDLGTVTANLSGWCTVPGHKAAGMTLDVRVADTGTDMPGMPGMSGMQQTPTTGAAAPVTSFDLHGTPGPGWTPYDATLPPASAATVHRITLRAEAREVEVAPGVRQEQWTYNGTAPGPTLRGKVGDLFVITLINDTTMGHGIDFHAGSVSPDVPMRTLMPGQSLVYQFRAQYSGAWLYHCSTMPMLEHIANGMYGAVIIDPPDLAPVSKEFVIVTSELFLGPQGGTADPIKLRDDAWDAAMFNGYPDQYVHAPLTVKAGERVRFWVVAAGPTEGTDFHVVGTQFDTVFKEGAYLLRPGNAEHGAAQVLDLDPAEGGFVETVFPAAGHYTMIDHDMRRGENGATGVIVVAPR